MYSGLAAVFDFHLAAEKLLNLLGLGQLVMIRVVKNADIVLHVLFDWVLISL